MTEKIFCSWNDFDLYITDIEKQLLASQWTPDYIVGVKRGGLIPAISLSHRFNKPLIMMSCQLRDHNDNEVRLYEVEELPKHKNVLIVDDICDSGETFQKIMYTLKRNGFNQIRTCSLFYNSSQSFLIDYKAKTISRLRDSRWIVFPWEKVIYV